MLLNCNMDSHMNNNDVGVEIKDKGIPQFNTFQKKPSIFNQNESGPSMKYVACIVVVLIILLMIGLFAIYGFKSISGKIMEMARNTKNNLHQPK